MRLVGLLLLVALASMVRAQEVSPAAAAEARAQFRSGQKAFRSGRFEDAERFLLAATRADPSLAAAHCALGQAYFAQKQYGAAVESLTSCKSLALEQAQRRQSNAASLDQQRDQEIQELRDTLRLLDSGQAKMADPHKGAAIEQRIRELESQKRRDLPEAVVPAEVSFALGTALLRTGALEGAERELREAVNARREYGEAHNNLAAAYVGLGRWPEAEDQVRLAQAAGFAVSPQLVADVQARRGSVNLGPRPPAEGPLQPSPSAGEDGDMLWIDHEIVECILADSFPLLEARFEGKPVAGARVKFRGASETQWYSVPMYRNRQGSHTAVLPKPKPGLTSLHYAIEVTAGDAEKTTTAEFTALVVRQSDACGEKHLAGLAVSPPMIMVELPEGTSSLPQGFSGKNAVAVYGSGKVRKGRPTTAVLAAVAAGGVAGGLSIFKDTPVGISGPTQLDAYVRLAGSSPPPGSTISLSRGSLSMTFDLYLPALIPAGGDVVVRLHEGLPDSSRACLTLTGSYGGEIPVFTLRQLTVGTPFASVDHSCGSSFDVTRARVVFRVAGGPYYQTAQNLQGAAPGLLDPTISYRFEP